MQCTQRTTVAGELRRRRGCRIGLGGLKAALRGRRGTFVILGSEWNRDGKLVLSLLPAELHEEYRRDYRQSGKPIGETGVLMTMQQLCDFADRWADRRIDDVPARDVTLLEEWPIYCRCWC
jgi:hypothetical protein